MKYILGTILLALFFCNSSDKVQNDDLKIEIVNNEINSKSNISKNDLLNVVKYDNYIYDSLPVNKISLKITNVGEKKYVFFLRNELNDFENTNIKVYNKDNVELVPDIMNFVVNPTRKEFFGRREILENEMDSLNVELNSKYLKEKITEDKIIYQREMSYVIIHPKETKYFTYYRTLPIYKDDRYSYKIYPFNKNDSYYFQMCLKCDSKEAKENLTANQLKEIKENGYTLFDGEILSNKVPIKIINMPK